MKIAPGIMLAIAAMLSASGCAAWNRGSLSLAPAPRPLAERTLDVAKFVAEHNKNAERIQTLEAKPTIGVSGRVMKARADGRLALERPHNFKLELSSARGAKEADLGSNDEEFWFWVSSEKSIYWCNYADLNSSALAITYQPDWIIEALGLKPITPEEAAKIKKQNGEVRGTTALVFPATKTGNETYTRMMIVDNQTMRIKQHRIYAGNLHSPSPSARSLLAQAEVSHFSDYDVGSADTAVAERCYLPESVKLEWKRDQLTLDVLMQAVKVNQFDSSRSTALFVEPVMPGHERRNLAELNRTDRKGTRTTVRQTLPPPDPGSGVKLGRPTPVQDDTSNVPRVPASAGVRSRGATTSPLEALVIPPLPVSPDNTTTQPSSGAWAQANLSQIDR
jgi:outer membrane lipoprotein-sorting protein